MSVVMSWDSYVTRRDVEQLKRDVSVLASCVADHERKGVSRVNGADITRRSGSSLVD
jgi:hypothetical protein